MISIVTIKLNSQIKIPIYLNESIEIEKRIENALSLMTLEEKIAMCHAQSKFSSAGCPRLGIPEIWMSDGPHGVRMEIDWDSWEYADWTNDSCIAFPALTCLAATFNPDLAFAYGNALGEEARYRKKDIILGPGVNIYRTPLNGRNFEYMGEDPFLSSTMVVPYITGVQQNGVSACLKHFILNNQEKWRQTINVELSDRALNEIYLPAFKSGVEKGKVWTVMGSYNKYRGEYCTHNDLLVNKILKNDWKFDGVFISDWGSTHDTKQAAINGLDIEMGTGTNGLTSNTASVYNNYYLSTPFLSMLKSGELSESLLDDKVRRILRLCFRTNMNRNRPWGSFGSKEHSIIAKKVAEEGIVLLKNENFFPIEKSENLKIAVIGENAVKELTKGGGSSELKAKYEVSPLEGLIKKYGKNNIIYSMGYASGPSVYGKVIPTTMDTDSLIEAAIKTAKSADIVLFFGGLNKNFLQDCEEGDRESLNLPFGQDKLISELTKVNKKIAVILLSGNAVAMPWLNNISGLIQGWYLGSETGNAIANIISGDVNPSGKLPFSFPKKIEDNSAYYFGIQSYPGDSLNVKYLDDIFVGYRWFEKNNIMPLFPFGFGLSYTTFKYGKINTDKTTYLPNDSVKLTFSLKNTGKFDGSEIVQLYMTQKNPSVIRPNKELKGFKKVFLKSGESKTVEMDVLINDFAYYNEKWVVEQDKYVLHLASSSTDIKGSKEIIIK